jgi:hypothetical protein
VQSRMAHLLRPHQLWCHLERVRVMLAAEDNQAGSGSRVMACRSGMRQSVDEHLVDCGGGGGGGFRGLLPPQRLSAVRVHRRPLLPRAGGSQLVASQ